MIRNTISVLAKNTRSLFTVTLEHVPSSSESARILSLPVLQQQIRNYAKSKDRKKEKKGAPVKVHINEDQLSEVINLRALRTQMEKGINTMKEDYIKNLSLRSATGAIETLKVEYEGKDYQLQELGQVVRKNPKTVVINLISFPQTIPAVLQAIQKSGMNLNPQQDGTTLYIPVPKVTREHREGLAKNAKSLFIKCRDTIKDAQNQTIKKLKKQTDISEDLNFQVQAQVTAVANEYIKEAEKMMEIKQAELLGDKL
ncbi:ribosome-recycling factor, mitochondrial [Topomyia yanbarensis]|uniref:ribosome-recycling factor, mitochondrial n=1 Tax=Topomyia yanbarensis TaxID=2498891 RepID=UPI00273B5667|nr:ribosome-recycling factor, mitochondrial [Topomyia yanbarensis]